MRFGMISALFRCAILAAPVVLAGCIVSEQDLADADLSRSIRECSGPSDANCFFLNSPVRLGSTKVNIPGRSYDFYPLVEALEFVDGRTKTWIAPPDTLTDGASIPEIFVRFIGDPTSAEFTNAAALHDAYCGIGNEDGPVYRSRTWQETHRLFYDALVVGGTNDTKAKIMFAAVWLGGPRWYVTNKREDTSMALLPTSLKVQAMKEANQFINRKNPSMEQLVNYLEWQERRMRRTVYGGRAASVAAPSLPNPPPTTEVVSPIGGGSGPVGPIQSP